MSARNASTTPIPCKHLADYKQRHGSGGYRSIQKHLKTRPNGRTSVSFDKFKVPRCSFCSGYRGRFYVCLICSSVSCCLSPVSNHALMHSQCEDGHEIAVDMERAELYCCVCRDQEYDPEFDKVVMRNYFSDMPGKGNAVLGSSSVVERTKKRRRLASGMELLDLKNPKPIVLERDRRSKSCFPLGLRGLNNLGSTCFMNSVLQALLHAPPFRNYFLSNRHNHQTCRSRSPDRLCMPCDIDVVFSAAYSGDRTPYSPARVLYSWWQHAENFAGYEQQDAHDFFISLLDQIHKKEEKTRNASKDNSDCHCIAHRVFSGILRSDVTCTACGFISTKCDPCVDISLDLDADSGSFTDSSRTGEANESTSISTLLGCLDLFTRAEKLGSDQKLYCQNCNERQDSLKQMSFRKLPLVLCLHIKRFEHCPIGNMSRKVDRHMQFPFSLDMTPYLSSSVVRNRFGNRIFSFEDDELDSFEFEVFAVITHSGMLESGHYVTYLRLQDQWYKCDDAWITEVDEEVVRSSQCYLIFYVQKVFYYRTAEDSSCLSFSTAGT